MIALALCLSCGRGEQAIRETPSAAPQQSRPEEGGTLVRRLEADVSTLNPVLATSRYDRQVANYLFTPLLYLDRDLRPVAGLAKTWEVRDAGRLYRFVLDERATFSDGEPVRASDVLFTLRRIVDPKTRAFQVAGGFEQIDLAATRVVDEKTIDVAFREPLASQLLRFNDVLVLPEHVYGKGSFRDDHNDVAVGSGPYRLKRREAGREIVLERRDDYWREKPFLHIVRFRVISDPITAWEALRNDEIDETFLRSDTWKRFRGSPATAHLDFRHFYTLNYNVIAWNLRDPVLSDVRVRRSLAACLPLQSIIENLYHGTARAVTGPFTEGQFAFNPRVAPMRYAPAEAARVLDSAGWRAGDGEGPREKDGRKLEFALTILSGTGTTAQFAQIFQSEARRIGADVRIVVADGAAAIERLLAGEFQAAYLSLDLDPDPDPFAILHSSQFAPRGQNFVFYSNSEVDRLIDLARRELDQSRRRALYWRLHELVAEEQPFTWTVQSASRWGIHRRVRGVEVSPGYGLFLWYPGELGWWIPRAQRRSGDA